MKKLSFSALLGLITVLLAGCVSAPKIPEGLTDNAVSADKSLVFLSTTALDGCTSFSTALEIYKKGDSPGKPLAMLQTNNSMFESHFSEHPGWINALELPPGRYTIYRRINNPYITGSNNFLNMEFEVKPSEILYLGELRVEGGCTYEDITINDQYDRDMTMVFQKSPALEKASIEKRLVGEPAN